MNGNASARSPVDVAFDAAPCRADPTGVGVYVHDLARALAASSTVSIGYIGVRSDGPLADLSESHATTPYPGGHHQRWLLRAAERDTRTLRSSIAHYTNAAAPLRSRRPYVLTIQDLSVIRYPRYHPPTRLLTIPVSVLSAYRAAAIIVPSEATRSELYRVLRVAGRRVVVIPHAARSSIATPPARRIADTVRRYLGAADARYVVSVGTLEPRKNHDRLVAAFEMLAATDPALRLVLIGALGWRAGSLVERIRRSPVTDRILLAGYIPTDDLTDLVTGALALAYVSVYEGFGLPVAEALRLGTPVVTSRTSSMPEAAGGRAILVDPRDTTSIQAGLIRAIAVRRHPATNAEEARERAWSTVADETIDVYRWVMSRASADNGG